MSSKNPKQLAELALADKAFWEKHLIGLKAYYVLGIWVDPQPSDKAIEGAVAHVQVGPGFEIDGVDAERGVIQLSITEGAPSLETAQSYYHEFLEDLNEKPLKDLGIHRFEMTWTLDVNAEVFGRSLPQYIDKKFLQDSDVFMESES